MSFVGFMKQINKTNQFLSEKVGGNKGTEIEEDFLELGRKLDAHNECLETIQERTRDFLQPNPNPHLAEAFSKLGDSLNDGTPYASSLVELGTAFTSISGAKDEMEERVKKHFVVPLSEMQEKDLKDIAHHRKKFESRRLDYDYKKRKVDKITPEEMQTAEDKFESSKEICYATMTNYLGREMEHISQLNGFANALRDYYQNCFQIMDSASGALSQQLSAAASMPRSERKINRKLHSEGSFEFVADDGEAESSHVPNVSAPYAPTDFPEPTDWPTPPTAHASSPSSQQTPCCRALFNFQAENDGELDIYEGDVIEITSKFSEEWLEGTCNGRYGYFPANYVEILVPI